MKIIRLAAIALVVMCVFIGIHSFVMNRMGKSLAKRSDKVEMLAGQEDWAAVCLELDEITAEWKKYSTWAALTISTEDIEQLEISLAQSQAFAKLHQKSDFFGEFIMFSKLVEHIPHREGFHIEEIL